MGRQKQVWKSIKGFEGLYEISNWGRIRSLNRFLPCKGSSRYHKGKVLIPQLHGSGNPYFAITLGRGDSLPEQHYIQRLVATAFIPNPKNKPQINHKDGNTLNNYFKNLEWATSGENHAHAYRSLGRKSNKTQLGKLGKDSAQVKKIIQYSLTGKKIAQYWGAREAERITGIKASNIQHAIYGDGCRKTAGGYIWKYAPGYSITKRKKKKKNGYQLPKR